MKKVGLVVIVLSALGIMAFNGAFKNQKIEVRAETPEMNSYEPIVVLELFTSQGCSSCPPADVLLEKMKNQFPEQVYALSYHVDYWDYIGWEDPFSNSNFTKKQSIYNTKFRNRSNYTPELVINGKEHFVGSSQAKMAAGIEKYKEEKTVNSLTLKNVKSNKGSVTFNYAVDGPQEGKDLRILLVLDERTTSVKRGENRNRTLKNSNVVVAEKISGISSSEQAVSIPIPNIVNATEKISLIVLVEDGDYTITAAAKQKIERI